MPTLIIVNHAENIPRAHNEFSNEHLHQQSQVPVVETRTTMNRERVKKDETQIYEIQLNSVQPILPPPLPSRDSSIHPSIRSCIPSLSEPDFCKKCLVFNKISFWLCILGTKAHRHARTQTVSHQFQTQFEQEAQLSDVKRHIVFPTAFAIFAAIPKSRKSVARRGDSF